MTQEILFSPCANILGLPLSCHCLALNTFPEQPQSNITISCALSTTYLNINLLCLSQDKFLVLSTLIHFHIYCITVGNKRAPRSNICDISPHILYVQHHIYHDPNAQSGNENFPSSLSFMTRSICREGFKIVGDLPRCRKLLGHLEGVKQKRCDHRQGCYPVTLFLLPDTFGTSQGNIEIEMLGTNTTSIFVGDT